LPLRDQLEGALPALPYPHLCLYLLKPYFVSVFSGKSAMAATVGIDSDFAYVKVVSSLVVASDLDSKFIYYQLKFPFFWSIPEYIYI
jgi:hypothetical protein